MIELKITGDTARDIEKALRELTAPFLRDADQSTMDFSSAKQHAAAPATPEETATPANDTSDVPGEGRVYGAAQEGKQRRLKAEIAEDAEIEELAAKMGMAKIPTDITAKELLADLRIRVENGKAADEEPAKSEPEPEQPKSEPEVLGPEATRDDMKAAMRRYVEAMGGLENAGEGLRKILGFAKQSDVPEDAAEFQKRIDAFNKAAEEAEAING